MNELNFILNKDEKPSKSVNYQKKKQQYDILYDILNCWNSYC